jgi:hypothetical protein
MILLKAAAMRRVSLLFENTESSHKWLFIRFDEKSSLGRIRSHTPQALEFIEHKHGLDQNTVAMRAVFCALERRWRGAEEIID